MAKISIPFCSPKRRFSSFQQQIFAEFESVLKEGQYILGSQVESFETEFAEYLGVKHCIGVANGTDAISLALIGLGIGAGDEVITPALTAHGTATGICQVGATPRFADVDPNTRCLDPDAVLATIGPRTAAIVLVHLYGRVGPIKQILDIAKKYNLAVIEDAAQAHGAHLDMKRVGSFGDAAAFSFYPTKNLGCIGDGGAVVTNSSQVGEKIRRARSYGWDNHKISYPNGMNSRLDELHASTLRILLPHLDGYNSEREFIAKKYLNELDGLPLILPKHPDGSIYHQFVVEIRNRDIFRQWLGDVGVGTEIHYPIGLNHMPAFPQLNLPITDRLTSSIVSLPIQPEVVANNQKYILSSMKDWLCQQMK